MNWSAHPTNSNYIQCTDYPSYSVLIRAKKLPKGYLWQAHKHYGYCKTVELAKYEALEVLLIQLVR
jgi:hypothetical protein